MIAETYFRLAPSFRGLSIVACADIVPAAATAMAEKYSVAALSVDGLLKEASIDTVVNLTVPNAHYDVTLAILSAGKNAYSEKPLARNARLARKLVADADKRGVKLGCAPDTFLGGAGQTARRLLDKGVIGKVVAGTAHVMSHGTSAPSFHFLCQPKLKKTASPRAIGPWFFSQARIASAGSKLGGAVEASRTQAGTISASGGTE